MSNLQIHRGTLHIKDTPIKRTGAFYVTEEADKVIAELVDNYKIAIEDIAQWGAYASEYFQEKHGLLKNIETHLAIINKHKPEVIEE